MKKQRKPEWEGETLFVNAHSVTRHYGGPEEGGWWYNRGAALCSIPVPAKRKALDHEFEESDTCYRCERSRDHAAHVRQGDEPFPACDFDAKDECANCGKMRTTHYDLEPMSTEEFVAATTAQGLTGDTRVEGLADEPQARPPMITADDAKHFLNYMLGYVNEGNIYSSTGGCLLRITVENDVAQDWSGPTSYE